MKKVRVRFAPSPTGCLHIGGVKTALYNYLFAKHNNGDFILRIEDTDRERFVDGAEEYIIESLKWLGIIPDEGIGFGNGKFSPYRQSERKDIYKKYITQLIDSGYAYYAFDTTDEISAMRDQLKASNINAKYDAITRSNMKNSLTLSADDVNEKIKNGDQHVVRVKLPRNEEIKFYDEIRGWITFNSNQMDDKVLFKSDGMPTYHFANVVDDYLMQISHVIRGEEWLSSTPLHILLYKYLGWEEFTPKFAHVPLILKPDGGGKLSKRDGVRLGFPVVPLEWKDPINGEISKGYRECGYLPEAIINFLALMGWNNGTTQEIFSMQELISAFSLDKINKAGAKFDLKKINWFNHQYMLKIDNSILIEKLKSILSEKNILNFTDTYIQDVCILIKEKITFLYEMWENCKYFFIAPINNTEIIKKISDQKIYIILNDLIDLFENPVKFSKTEIEISYYEILNKNNVTNKEFSQTFRMYLTGTTTGFPLFEVIVLLGRDIVTERIKTALQTLNKQEHGK